MNELIFITGNPKKAHYAAENLGIPVTHRKMDLPEIQSLSLDEIINAKLDAAYAAVGKPVFCEDVSLELKAFGRLPGPFIKFFVKEIGAEGICRMLDGKSRAAEAKCLIGYTDGGKKKQFFTGTLCGKIAEHPIEGSQGFGIIGWDSIFIPDGYETARSALTPEQYKKTYLSLRRFDLFKSFLSDK